ncbi:HD domain-containing phosphohydrolase [Terasakiella sp. A23]|uniref:HD domain-containing phosphohydrolase n=1 Tax=Terasakiella sp. FCG-A23 TaxID=3080561 RepID=UPI0029552656|nr:HD domain-containing phosphohydrolase [Terasakiella sp. A23]MDV7340370.1 HD domain-containing phosphohydrolase [Terasakiella sp. A23]
MKFRFKLRTHLGTAFVGLTLFVGLILGLISYLQSEQIIQNLTTQTFLRIENETILETKNLFSPAQSAVELMANHAITQDETWDERRSHISFLFSALDTAPNITSVYIGYEDGDFLLVRRLPKDTDHQTKFSAPENTAYIAQSIDREGDSVMGLYAYFHADHSLIHQEMRPDYNSYDPRKRPWFISGSQTTRSIITAPYVFFTTQEVGSTVAKQARFSKAIVGTDITLQTLANTLSGFKITPGTEVTLLDGSGHVVAYPDRSKGVIKTDKGVTQAHLNDLHVPVLSKPYKTFLDSPKDKCSLEIKLDDKQWQTLIAPIPVNEETSYILALAVPEDELLADVNALLEKAALLLLLALTFICLVSIFLGQWLARPIKTLVDETEAIKRFDFSRPINIRSTITEVDILAQSMGTMKSTIQQFVDINEAILAEDDFDTLLNLLLDKTVQASGGDAGAIYVLSNDESQLKPASLLLNGKAAKAPDLQRLEMDNLPNFIRNAITSQIPKQQKVTPDTSFTLLETLLKNSPQSCYLVAVPLFNHEKELVALILMVHDGKMDTAHLDFVRALSNTAAMSVDTRQLIVAQKKLFDSFIRLIAGAIDAKSAYTGGHCARVPELTKMMARAAEKETDGLFKDFQLDDEEWEEVHVAAWLHDCGKMTTPEFVIDKATKLETIYDRIHEIRMRFELIKKETECDFWQAKAQGETPEPIEATLRQLDEDFAFIAQCNEGGESLAEGSIERLKEIASRNWTRTLDDTIGISYEEKQRKTYPGNKVTLPVKEALLADRADHIFTRPKQDVLMADNPWGFKVDVPEHLYNRGELYNLSINKGTLTPEERFKINEHIIQTISMLEELPYPKHLQNVPEIAGGHHETMDGRGYPRQLKKEDMSPVARMMAIADIFEALTAIDRPYKKGKTLSESIEILSYMRDDNHIDGDLFTLFLKSGVYLEYANKFMQKDQIDEVDIDQYLT